jgi:hypothetical protein
VCDQEQAGVRRLDLDAAQGVIAERVEVARSGERVHRQVAREQHDEDRARAREHEAEALRARQWCA